AWLAGMRAGLYPDLQGFADTWARDVQFTPAMPEADRDANYARWKRAVAATQTV
ncbi:MAG: glycerol kinase, partial [Pseudomonadota bacterium]